MGIAKLGRTMGKCAKAGTDPHPVYASRRQGIGRTFAADSFSGAAFAAALFLQ